MQNDISNASLQLTNGCIVTDLSYCSWQLFFTIPIDVFVCTIGFDKFWVHYYNWKYTKVICNIATVVISNALLHLTKFLYALLYALLKETFLKSNKNNRELLYVQHEFTAFECTIETVRSLPQLYVLILCNLCLESFWS